MHEISIWYTRYSALSAISNPFDDVRIIDGGYEFGDGSGSLESENEDHILKVADDIDKHKYPNVGLMSIPGSSTFTLPLIFGTEALQIGEGAAIWYWPSADTYYYVSEDRKLCLGWYHDNPKDTSESGLR